MNLLFMIGFAIAVTCGYAIYTAIYASTQPWQRVPVQPQQPQRLMLTDGRMAFNQIMRDSINALPMPAREKGGLFDFTLDADERLARLMMAENVPVMRTSVHFGALTITFRLKLREIGRKHLDNLMKLDELIAQALSVESVVLAQGPGYIDCEVSSPVRFSVDVRTLQRSTKGANVAIGLDTTLKPIVVDISQHGLIGAIGPSRRGKTQAIKSLIYQLKCANPDYKMVIVAKKIADWQAFAHCAVIIIDTEESQQFQKWLLATMDERGKRPAADRWIVVFDDLANQVQGDKGVADTVARTASLGAGTGITTIASTQMTGAFSGGSAVFANCTCKLMFKPASNQQGARDGGMAGLGLDQLSEQKGDCITLIDGFRTRAATAMTADSMIQQLASGVPNQEWLAPTAENFQTLTLDPREELIEKLNGWLLEDGAFDWENGKFSNRSEALKRLEWHNNTHYRSKLSDLEQYIYSQSDRLS